MTTTNNQKFMRLFVIGLLSTIIFICYSTYTTGNYRITVRLLQKLETDVTDYITTTRSNSIRLQNNKHVQYDDDSVARNLSQKVRVLIAVMTSPGNLKKRSQSVKDTWGKRCRKIIYFSTEENKEFPTIGLDVPEGYKHLTAKTMAAFRYLYDHFLYDFDWFMKADDDTFVIVENLVYFLAYKNYSEPVYFGHHLRPLVKQGYHGGGAGYVLSKESLRRFGENASSVNCRKDGGAEDVEMGRCLEKLGVRIDASTDFRGRSLFHSLTPEKHLFGDYPKWYYYYDASRGTKKGKETMNEYVISFHKMTPENMRLLDFYVYNLRPYGTVNGEHKFDYSSIQSNYSSTQSNYSSTQSNYSSTQSNYNSTQSNYNST